MPVSWELAFFSCLFSPSSDQKAETAEGQLVPSACPGVGGGEFSPLGPLPSFCGDLMAASWKTKKPNGEMRGSISGLHRMCL